VSAATIAGVWNSIARDRIAALACVTSNVLHECDETRRELQDRIHTGRFIRQLVSPHATWRSFESGCKRLGRASTHLIADRLRVRTCTSWKREHSQMSISHTAALAIEQVCRHLTLRIVCHALDGGMNRVLQRRVVVGRSCGSLSRDLMRRHEIFVVHMDRRVVMSPHTIRGSSFARLGWGDRLVAGVASDWIRSDQSADFTDEEGRISQPAGASDTVHGR
jgi:hypothetical protein